MSSVPVPARVAGVVTALEALVLAGVLGFYGYELGQGQGNPTRVVMSALVIATFAVLLGVLARGWFQGKAWPRTPTIVWNLLLLPTALTVFQAGSYAVAGALTIAALAAIAAATKSPPSDHA